MGFPAPGDFTATLLDPRFRDLGPGPEPLPLPASSDSILEGRHASTLVRLEARLLEDTRPQPGASLVLQAGNVVLEALVPQTSETYPSAPWPAGTQLAVNGVVVLQLGPSNQPKSFRLLTRRLADFAVLSRPSWWNLHRLARILGVMAAAGSLVLAWSLVLARKNRELRRANVEARSANEAKSRFLATMSHEIRTPLNGVTGMLHLLLRDDPTPKQRHRIELAQSSASTLLRVINDILDFSRIEAGKLDLHWAPTALRPTISKASTPISFKTTEKGLAWNLVIAPETPEWVITDPDRLTQILGNLLANAAKFTETGSITLRVKPIPRSADTVTVVTVRFEVIDTGPGIAPEQLGRLFKPFSQVDNSSTRRHGGTGLGLGICKELAELMGGRIGVQSQPGVGSTFWLDIPFQTTSAPPADGTPLPPVPTS
jgi:signal transduction histidine kinase